MVGQLLKSKNATSYFIRDCVYFVRVIGLEPTRLAAPDPKSGMSTNFTIPAKITSLNVCFYEVFGELPFVSANIDITL